MKTRPAPILMAAAVLCATAASVSGAQSRAPAGPLHLIHVPYLPQSEALCGGAAAAMVMRYWGASDVYAESFADLVDREAGGIRADNLLRALRSRGWDAQSLRGDPALVRAQLDRRQPVIALIEDRPGRFHYVVVVGWREGRVFLHDPARAPFRVLAEGVFNNAWEVAGFWTLVLSPLPSSGKTALTTIDDKEPLPPSVATAEAPCAAMVEEGVRLSGMGDRLAARELLEMAAAACPDAAAPWRELAGLDALQSEWRQATVHAREAIRRNRLDRHAWRILATGLYLEGNPLSALAAWNALDEPRIDLVNIIGLERTRYAVAVRRLGLEARTLLTPAVLSAAARKLTDMPAAHVARVTYRPGENGRAQIDATIIERPLIPTSPMSLAAIGARLLSDRELSASVSSPTGGGEVWTASWRWWDKRPRFALGLAAPAGFGGVWRVDVFDERQAYGTENGVIDEHQRSARVGMADWITGTTRIDLAAGIDRWRDRGRALSFHAQLGQILARDSIELTGSAGMWLGSAPTWTLALTADWRSSPAREGDVWIARAGVDSADNSAPLALWGGAGTGQGRQELLRAHPLLVDGVIRDAVFGRRVVHAGFEWRRWMRPRAMPVRVAPTAFIDAARAFVGLPTSDTRAHVDAGVGVRIGLPAAGVIRIDAARGLRDGRMALSVGWTK